MKATGLSHLQAIFHFLARWLLFGWFGKNKIQSFVGLVMFGCRDGADLKIFHLREANQNK